MEDRKLGFCFVIIIIIVLFLCLRLTTTIEPTNKFEDNLQEIEVTRDEVKPDDIPKKVAKDNTKNNKKKRNKKNKNKTIVKDLFEDIKDNESSDYNAVIEITSTQDSIITIEKIDHPDQDYRNYVANNDDIKISDSLEDEFDNKG